MALSSTSLRVDQLELLVEDVGSFVEPPLLLAEVAANAIDLDFEVFAPLEDFLLGGQFALLANRVGLEPGARENLVGEPARSSRGTARSGTRRPARSTHPKAARRNRSGKLLQVAARPDREPADRAMNLSGRSGRERVRTPSTAQTRSLTHRHVRRMRASQKGNIGRWIDTVKRSHLMFARQSQVRCATCLQVASNTKTTVLACASGKHRRQARGPISNRAGTRPVTARGESAAHARFRRPRKTKPSRLDTTTQRVVSTEISPGQ